MELYGFVLEREEYLPELSSQARLWSHQATGAPLLSFINKDENKVFGVSFRTPPADSTGVAHILEHSVLCGSEKYPVKEPFVELLKGSLQTFLNAFTYPDKTCYPVASANLHDFYNLVDVYLDAVFFPRITKDIFRQEGWHLEPGENDQGFIFKGVVYNEMKGAFSAPESVLARHSLHTLFPDTVYALESGGAPDVIPDLTYEAFVEFHAKYYHPSNARFYFWGDDPEEQRLERLSTLLQRFNHSEASPPVALQTPFAQPRASSVQFAATEGDDKGMVVLNWLGPDVMHTELVLAFHMLEHMLLGMPASPLRRALIESGLGEDLAGQGLESELRQLIFDTGLKGVSPGNEARIEELILSCLTSLAREGLEAELVEAAINSIEFALREKNSGRFPVGLSVMLSSLTTWLHNGDPLLPLRFEAPLEIIKQKVASGSGYFEGIIQRWLIDNPHRVTVTLVPDSSLPARQEEEEAARVAAMTATLDATGKQSLVEEVEHLRLWQSTPDSPELLATIPRLGVGDLPLENSPSSGELLVLPSVAGMFHPLPTNGIVYVEASFDLSAVPEYILPLLPLFGRALLEMGTRNRDFADLNMTIARTTGGMDGSNLFLTYADSRAPVARFILSGKAAPDKVDALFDLMGEVLTECVFDQQERFVQMILEEKARIEHSLVPGGHMVVANRLRGSLSSAGMLSELTSGISNLAYVRRLADRTRDDWAGVLQDLEILHRTIIHGPGLALNVTALEEQRAQLEQCSLAFSRRLPDQSTDGPAAWLNKLAEFPLREALVLPAQVNYVGKAVNMFDHGYEWHGSASVVLKYLRTGYLWEKVRVRGGAYGCLCGLNRMSGAFFMVSYRDPNILQTLDVFDAAALHLQQHTFTKEEVDAAIVGAIGELDSYLLPDAKGSASFARALCGDTPERRQQLRDEILATTVDHFAEFGHALEVLTSQGRTCALGGASLERIANERGWAVEKIL